MIIHNSEQAYQAFSRLQGKGRRKSGEKNERVYDAGERNSRILTDFQMGMGRGDLADKYSLSRSMINLIIRGKR